MTEPPKKNLKIMFVNAPAFGEFNPTRRIVKQFVDMGHSVDYYIIDNYQRGDDVNNDIKEKIEEAGANFVLVDLKFENLPDDYKNLVYDYLGSQSVYMNQTSGEWFKSFFRIGACSCGGREGI